MPATLQLHSRSPYRLLLGYAARNRQGWALIFAVTLVTTAASLLTPWPMKVLVDNVLHGEPAAGFASWLPGAGQRETLLVYAAAASLLLFALSSALNAANTMLWVRVGQGMVYDFAADVFAAVQRRSLRFHQRHPLGDTLQRVTGDAWVVHDVVDTLLFAPLHNVLLLLGMAVLMFALNPLMAGIALAVGPVIGLGSMVLGRRVRAAGEAQRQVDGEMASHLHQTLTGMPVVQAFGQEDRVHERFLQLTTAAVAAHRRRALVGHTNGLATGGITVVGHGIVLWVGAVFALQGRLTVGELLVFLSYLGTLQSTLSGFADIYPTLQGVRPKTERVMEVLGPDDDVPDSGAVVLGRAGGHVRFEGVSFSYEPGREVLHEVSFEAAPGETVALVGATGAGKSTVASLVMRFYDPDSGRVLLDGHDLRDVVLGDLRRQVGLVLQESFLFPISIADNIAYGRPDASMDEIEAAARAANAHEFISELPDGYATVVGERGATLSGGQRQRVAIARALLKDAPVLVLDEPTSALDAQTEGLLLGALDRLMQGRTTIVIAHRLSTIRRADRIVVLDHGRVIESGSHDQLMARNGTYATMHQLQSGDLPSPLDLDVVSVARPDTLPRVVHG
jgi:ATP-binding cassette, subfamily B, bacterial